METSLSTSSLQTLSLSMKLRSDAIGLPPRNQNVMFPKTLSSSTSSSGSHYGSVVHNPASGPGEKRMTKRRDKQLQQDEGLPRLSASTESITSASASNRNANGTLNFGGVSGSSRISGLYDEMALNASSHSFVDRDPILHPSTVCVRCSKTASVCVDCCQYQQESALYFYRNARATGAVRFFEKGIIRAGQTNLVKFVIFREWFNLVKRLKRLNTKFEMTADLEFRKTNTYIPFNAWKRFVKDQILTTKNQTIDDLIGKGTSMSNTIAKLQTDITGLGYQVKQLQVEATKKGDLIGIAEDKLKELEKQLALERTRNMHLCEFIKPMLSYQQQLDANFMNQLEHTKLDLDCIKERLHKNLFIDKSEDHEIGFQSDNLCSVDVLANMVTINLNLVGASTDGQGSAHAASISGNAGTSVGEEKEADGSSSVGGGKAKLTDAFLLTWAFDRSSSLENFDGIVDRRSASGREKTSSTNGPQLLTVAEQLLVLEDAPSSAKPLNSKLAKGKKKVKDDKKEKVEVFNFNTFFKQLVSPELIPQTKVNVVDITFKPEGTGTTSEASVAPPPLIPKSKLASFKSGHVFAKLALSVILTHLKHYHSLNRVVSEEVKGNMLGDMFQRKSSEEQQQPLLLADNNLAGEELTSEGAKVMHLDAETAVPSDDTDTPVEDESKTNDAIAPPVTTESINPPYAANVCIFGDYRPLDLSGIAPFATMRLFSPLKSSDLLRIKELYMSAVNSEEAARDLMSKVLDLYSTYFDLSYPIALSSSDSKILTTATEISRGNESLIRWLLLTMMQHSVVTYDSVLPLIDLFQNYNVFIEANISAIRSLSNDFCGLFEEEQEQEEQRIKEIKQEPDESAITIPLDTSLPPPQPARSPLEKYNLLGQKIDNYFSNMKGKLSDKTKAVSENMILFSRQKCYIYEFLHNLLKTSSFGNYDLDYLRVFAAPFL